MRAVLTFFIAVMSSTAMAQVQATSDNLKNNRFTLTVTGQDAMTLKKLVSDYDGKEDMYLSQEANKQDNSSIRYIGCKSETCTVIFEGDVFTNKDSQDYYTGSFNRKIKSLREDQVLVINAVRGLTGAPSFYESRIIKLLQENRNEVKGIRLKAIRPRNSTRAENVSSLVYEIGLKLNRIELQCYSSITTGMGVTNFLSENCSFAAIVDIK